MRAYMSDPNAGPTFLDGDLAAYTDGSTFKHGGPRDDAFAAAWAMQEALRILGETEPKQDNAMLGPGYWTAFEIGEQYPNTSPCADFGGALAEALKGFIAE
jgi:hypothetical protein